MADSGNPIPEAASEANTLRFRDDPVPDEPAVSLDAFLDQTNAASVRIEAGDDVRRLGPVLDRVRLVAQALKRFPFVYQDAADAAVPVWKLRHG